MKLESENINKISVHMRSCYKLLNFVETVEESTCYMLKALFYENQKFKIRFDRSHWPEEVTFDRSHKVFERTMTDDRLLLSNCGMFLSFCNARRWEKNNQECRRRRNSFYIKFFFVKNVSEVKWWKRCWTNY